MNCVLYDRLIKSIHHLVIHNIKKKKNQTEYEEINNKNLLFVIEIIYCNRKNYLNELLLDIDISLNSLVIIYFYLFKCIDINIYIMVIFYYMSSKI